ncbi:MAG TPA: hypothetical protein DCW95_04390 [Chryseobacterium sp.]|nr:hypothetical protein [Chryseobacterium sp.]
MIFHFGTVIEGKVFNNIKKHKIMARTNLISKMQLFALAIVANLVTVWVKAQDAAPDLKVDMDVDKGSDAGFMSGPLLWVIIALAVIILIAVVARGNGNK